MKQRTRTMIILLIILTLIPLSLFPTGNNENNSNSNIMELNPKETLVISGVEWGAPTNFNPLESSGHVAGKYQMVYENLFHYNLEEGELKPWLAAEGKWETKTDFLIKLRKNVQFTDGQNFTSDDVIFTFELGKNLTAVEWSGLWDWTERIEKIDDYTVRFHFSNPHYHELLFLLYRVPIIPEHIWSKLSDDEKLQTLNNDCIATGAYKFGMALDNKMIWTRNENWWGNTVFGAPAPKHIVFPLVYDNNVALGMVMKGELDVCNNYLPGLEKIKDDYGLVTYYKNEPYNRSANVAMLYMNHKKSPMNNKSFRKAVAYAINPDLIVNNVYGGQVQKSNAIGFLNFDFWMQYYDEDVVTQYGHNYNPDKAKSLLDSIGIIDKNGDGFRENSDGSVIDLKIICPSGWTDWMLSIQMISKSLEAVGIKLRPAYPDFGLYMEQLTGGTFDMAINNFNSVLSPTPWTFWNCVINDELFRDTITFGNFGRYNNPELFKLVDQFNETQIGSAEGKSIASKIQKIYLEEMPNIPVWYNGFWSAASTANWTGWPTEHENSEGIASGYGYYYSLGGYEMLLNLEPQK